MEVVRSEPVLPAQEPEGSPEDVPAAREVGALARGKRRAPSEEEPPIQLAERGAGLHHERAHGGVEGDAGHERRIDQHAHGGVIDEALETVAAAADDHAEIVAYGLLDR